MGYHTDLKGSFTCTPTLKEEHAQYLRRFNRTRRMKRRAELLEDVPDPVREAAGLPLGVDGAYFTGSQAPSGQDFDHPSAMKNERPTEWPGFWCPWTASEDGTRIEWDGDEKPREYVDWLKYLIEHFLEPWGYELEGVVHWEGEEPTDTGTIEVLANKVRVREDEIPDSGLKDYYHSLIRDLDTGDRDARRTAIRMSLNVVHNSRPLTMALLRRVDDAAPDIRVNAVRAAAELLSSDRWIQDEIRRDPIDAIQLLLSGLKSPDSSVQAASAHALGHLGTVAEPVVPLLEKLRDSSEDLPHRRAKEAIERILRP